MIAPGAHVRTMTGKTGVVLSTNVSTSDGPRVQVSIGPLLLCSRAGDSESIIPALAVFYHPDDLIIIAAPEATQ